MNHSISVGLEQGTDNQIRAHSLELLGLEVIGPDAEVAAARLVETIQAALPVMAELKLVVPPAEAELKIEVDEWIQTVSEVGKGQTTACFQRDLTRLEDRELFRALDLLGALRGRILDRVRRLKNEALDAVPAGDTTLRHLLDELAAAQWWTLSRLGASSLAEVPDQVVGRLDTSMALIVQRLTELPDDARDSLVELEGEEWTPRKVVRRLLWLEWTYGNAALHSLGVETAA